MNARLSVEQILLDREACTLSFDTVNIPYDFFRQVIEKSTFITRGDEGNLYKVTDLHLLESVLPLPLQEPVCLKIHHDYHWYRESYFVHRWNPTGGCAELLRIGEENSTFTSYVERPLIFWQQILRVVTSVLFPDKMPKYYASFIGEMPLMLSSQLSFESLPYAQAVMITEFIAPHSQIAQALQEMRLSLYQKDNQENWRTIRHQFDTYIQDFVGKKAEDDVNFFKSVGFNLGHWQANTNGIKYYEVWPLIDYPTLYQAIFNGKFPLRKTLLPAEKSLLYDCFKRLLLYNALVLFERKRLKYELLNPDSKSPTPHQIETIADEMWRCENGRNSKGESSFYFYKNLKQYAREVAKDDDQQAKQIFQKIISDNITESRLLPPSLQKYFYVLGGSVFEGIELRVSKSDYSKIETSIQTKIDSIFSEHIPSYNRMELIDIIRAVMRLDYL